MEKEIIVEYDEKEYSIKLEVVKYLGELTYGRYIPEEKKIIIVENCHISTIYHESIHAAIDMFRSTNENFSEIFDIKCKYGEEAFCHYVCEIANGIIEEIK